MWDFYISFSVFNKTFAIHAKKLLYVYEFVLSDLHNKVDTKIFDVDIKGEKIPIINPFALFTGYNEIKAFELVMVFETFSEETMGMPVDNINQLHIVNEEQLIHAKNKKVPNGFYTNENQQIEIIDNWLNIF